MKTLNIIQTLAKIGKIICQIIFVCSIIGIIGCIISLICIPFTDKAYVELNGMTIRGFIYNETGFELKTLYPLISGALVICIGEGIIAKFAELYFKNEINAGTPFTINGSKELLRLGILTICISLGALILAKIISAIIVELTGYGEVFDVTNDSITIGLMFIIVSLLTKHGAEIKEKEVSQIN